MSGVNKCIKGVDFATGQAIDICPGRGIDKPVKEYPKREVSSVDPTNFAYKGFDLPVLGPTLGCQFVDRMKGTENPLHYVGDFYAWLFAFGRDIDGGTIGNVADAIGVDQQENQHMMWWVARGGAPLALHAIWSEMRQINNTQEAVGVLKNALTRATTAGDTATADIINDLLNRPSEVLRNELTQLEASSRTLGNTALADSLKRVLNPTNSKGVEHPVSTKDVAGSAKQAQAKVLNNVRRTIIGEIHTSLGNVATPVEAREALKRVMNTPGKKNTWEFLVKELAELTKNQNTQAAGFVEQVVNNVKARHTADISFIEAVDKASEQATARVWNAFRGPATDADVLAARKNLMPSIIRDNLLGAADGANRFPFAFGADNGLLVEKRKALKEIEKAKKDLKNSAIAADPTKVAEVKLRQQQFKFAADEIEGILKGSKGKGVAGLIDEIDVALARSRGAGLLGAPAVKALEKVIATGQIPIENALGIGMGSSLNLASEVAEGRSPLWRRVRGLTAGAYENHTAFRTWLATWLTFSGILRGPDEILDVFGGKDLRGASRDIAYNGLAYVGLGASALIVNQEYSRMVSGAGRTKASIGYGFTAFWLAYVTYWFSRSDQREALRLQGGDPDSVGNPLNFTKNGYNPNRYVSQYYAWAAEAPLWALMPKISKLMAEGIADKFGWATKGEMVVTAAERTALLSDTEFAVLQSRGLANLGSKSWVYSKEGVRAVRAAFGTWPRNRAFLLWLTTGMLGGTFLGTASNYARSITEGNSLAGGSIRPIFTSTGSQIFTSALDALGIDVPGYGYYFLGMLYLFPWDYCNEIVGVAPKLAMMNVEWYRQEDPGTPEAEQKIQSFRHFYQMSTPQDQMDIRKKFYDRFPELFDGDISRTEHSSLLPTDMMDASAMACVAPEGFDAPPALPDLGVDFNDPWLAALLPGG